MIYHLKVKQIYLNNAYKILEMKSLIHLQRKMQKIILIQVKSYNYQINNQNSNLRKQMNKNIQLRI
ncbi:unnamed protein product [Paramecium sonneborni]|uniref:Uncharacterized protein n=1 Tax=Paramecium sonneborni TaxID=65129 RepID=A0A8S1NBI0_9CILI|nr:unnamed protein product [Paramecium sonneborni]